MKRTSWQSIQPRQTYLFHLRHRQAKKQLFVIWEGVQLKHCTAPVYLSVTLDRTSNAVNLNRLYSYRQHVVKLQGKLQTRNSLLRKLTNSTWGADPTTVRTTALALCYSTAEYVCRVWGRSAHAKKVDIALNESCRCITGCIQSTNIDSLYILAGIAPSAIRRTVASRRERSRQIEDPRRPLYGHCPARQRLQSRKIFMNSVLPLIESLEVTRLEPTTTWRETLYYSPATREGTATTGQHKWLADVENAKPTTVWRRQKSFVYGNMWLYQWHHVWMRSIWTDCPAYATLSITG